MRRYDAEFRIEAVKLSNKIGPGKASKELGIPINTMSTWRRKAEDGTLEAAPIGTKTALSLAEENKRLKQEIRELRETNEILRKASIFFAASQKK